MPTQVTITAMLTGETAATQFIDSFNEWTGGVSELFALTRDTPSGELEIEYSIGQKHIDAHGRINPQWDGNPATRFVIYDDPADRDAATEEDDWRYKLTLVDNKYTDSDSLPITSHPHGTTREAAYVCAADFIKAAVESESCVF